MPLGRPSLSRTDEPIASKAMAVFSLYPAPPFNCSCQSIAPVAASILATNKAISGKISGFPLYLGLGGSLVVGYIVGGIVERKVGE